MTAGKRNQARGDNVVPLRAARPCPICARKSTPAFHPFCSKHCADVDLNRWLKGSYAIPAVEPPDDWDGTAERDGADEE